MHAHRALSLSALHPFGIRASVPIFDCTPSLQNLQFFPETYLSALAVAILFSSLNRSSANPPKTVKYPPIIVDHIVQELGAIAKNNLPAIFQPRQSTATLDGHRGLYSTTPIRALVVYPAPLIMIEIIVLHGQ